MKLIKELRVDISEPVRIFDRIFKRSYYDNDEINQLHFEDDEYSFRRKYEFLESQFNFKFDECSETSKDLGIIDI